MKCLFLSPTKTSGSRLEMFTNVKSQMTGWLGNASIPGLRKGDDQQQGAGDQQQPANTADQQQSATATEKADTGVKDEDDNSRYKIRYGPFSMMIDLINILK